MPRTSSPALSLAMNAKTSAKTNVATDAVMRMVFLELYSTSLVKLAEAEVSDCFLHVLKEYRRWDSILPLFLEKESSCCPGYTWIAWIGLKYDVHHIHGKLIVNHAFAEGFPNLASAEGFPNPVSCEKWPFENLSLCFRFRARSSPASQRA